MQSLLVRHLVPERRLPRGRRQGRGQQRLQEDVHHGPDYPAGKDALNGFKRGYKAAPGDEVYTKLGQIDYAAELAQIRAAKPDAVYIFLPGGMGINFVKQFVSAGLSQSIKLIGPGFSADEDVIQAVGEPMLGMVNTAQWAHDLDVPQNKAFVEAFRKEYNGRYPRSTRPRPTT